MIRFNLKRDKKGKLNLDVNLTGEVEYDIDEEEAILEKKRELLKKEIQRAVDEMLSKYRQRRIVSVEQSAREMAARGLLSDYIYSKYKDEVK